MSDRADSISVVTTDSASTAAGPGTGGTLQLISDGDGVVVIGDQSAVERFLVSEGLDHAPSKDFGTLLWPSLGAAAQVAIKGSEIAAQSGRWVQVTAESAEKIARYGLMPTTTPHVSHAMIGPRGDVQSWIQIVTGPGPLANNPAALAGVGGIMAQVALQQMMREITDYLAVIDEKVDDILRAQKDAVLADMIGVDLVIEEAMTIREEVGRVSDVTWSKVQGTALTIARTQAYAVRQLDALAQKLERKADLGNVAAAAREAESKVQEWLAVVARCIQLQDGIAVLELDRLMDSSPDDLNKHRVALRVARQNRLDLIARSAAQLLLRMKTAADRANSEVLTHPLAAPSIVQSNNRVNGRVVEFQGRLGITREAESLEARQWISAADDAWQNALQLGSKGVDAAGRFGAKTVEAFQAVDLDGDGVPDKPLALSMVEDAGAAVTGVAASAADVAANAAEAFGSWLRRLPGRAKASGTPDESESASKPAEH